MNPYLKLIAEAKEVMKGLVQLMVQEPDMKKFKNIAAVYVVWQHEHHNLELETLK